MTTSLEAGYTLLDLSFVFANIDDFCLFFTAIHKIPEFLDLQSFCQLNTLLAVILLPIVKDRMFWCSSLLLEFGGLGFSLNSMGSMGLGIDFA
jgi:hypothetical protein